MPVQLIIDLIQSRNRLKKHVFSMGLFATILAAVSLYLWDQNLSNFFSRPDIQINWYQPARKLTDLGLSDIYFFMALGAWLFAKYLAPRLSRFRGDFARIDYIRRWGLNFLAALALCGVVTHLFKFFVGRQRPHKSPISDPMVFSPMTTHWHWHSFSSGHSQVAITAAVMLSLAFPKWRWPFLILGSLICFTRVMVYDHFLSDIIVGGFIGYAGTLLTLHLMQTKTKQGLY